MTAILLIPLMIMLAIAGYLLSAYVKKRKNIERCNKWPLITARLVRKTVVEKKTFAGVKGSAKISFYIPDIDYIFNINGRDFEGHARLRREWTPVLPQEFSTANGQTVEVHYNPENPSENTPGLEKAPLIDELYPIILLILGSIGIVIMMINS